MGGSWCGKRIPGSLGCRQVSPGNVRCTQIGIDEIIFLKSDPSEPFQEYPCYGGTAMHWTEKNI
jgi:hypothetical protein